MRFYILEPEVAGGPGSDTEMDATVHPPCVHKLHYELDGWLGDDLLESFPCYIVTERLMPELGKLGLSGCDFGNVKITKSKQFADLHAGRNIPKFRWLKVHGEAGADDFGISDDNMLVVSERILKILSQFQSDHCDVEEYVEDSVELLAASG
ncbi:hypothetical protein QUF72_00900 [Desulfobacterales bacterium HSG2]|nr:hypothetical protein [Desulfobacterales bacterium HSG2]